jgi:adenylate cyclase
MAVEIERKFLIANENWRAACSGQIDLRDGLIMVSGDRQVRVRIAGEIATLTIKGNRSGPARDEFEFAIPLHDAEALIIAFCHDQTLRKTRFLVPHDGSNWQIDVYHDALDGLVFAELELDHPDAPFIRPDWLGEEITGDPRYSKASLVSLGRTQATTGP